MALQFVKVEYAEPVGVLPGERRDPARAGRRVGGVPKLHCGGRLARLGQYDPALTRNPWYWCSDGCKGSPW
jgi:hypothetical protein